jgi:hypothetical protein
MGWGFFHRKDPASLGLLICTTAMADLLMVAPSEVVELGLSSTMVEREEYEAAVARRSQAPVAATTDAALSGDGPQEAQQAASEPLDVSVEAGVAKKPRRARKPAPGDDAGQFVPDDPATPDVNEAYEPTEA